MSKANSMWVVAYQRRLFEGRPVSLLIWMNRYLQYELFDRRES